MSENDDHDAAHPPQHLETGSRYTRCAGLKGRLRTPVGLMNADTWPGEDLLAPCGDRFTGDPRSPSHATRLDVSITRARLHPMATRANATRKMLDRGFMQKGRGENKNERAHDTKNRRVPPRKGNDVTRISAHVPQM